MLQWWYLLVICRFKNTRSYTRFNFAKQYFNTEHVLAVLLYILPASGGKEKLKEPQAGAGRYFKAATLECSPAVQAFFPPDSYFVITRWKLGKNVRYSLKSPHFPTPSLVSMDVIMIREIKKNTGTVENTKYVYCQLCCGVTPLYRCTYGHPQNLQLVWWKRFINWATCELEKRQCCTCAPYETVFWKQEKPPTTEEELIYFTFHVSAYLCK